MDLYNSLKMCKEISYTHVSRGGDYAVIKGRDTLKIFFEWSDGIGDWIYNLNFVPMPTQPYKDMEDGWRCHRGFLKVWKAIEPHVAKYIYDPSISKIEVSGYSHGAALALLCHEYCVYHRPDIVVEGAGFGCPRVMWGEVPDSVAKRFSGFNVLWNGNDIVCNIPPTWLGFRHVGNVVRLEGSVNPIKDHYAEEYLKKL